MPGNGIIDNMAERMAESVALSESKLNRYSWEKFAKQLDAARKSITEKKGQP